MGRFKTLVPLFVVSKVDSFLLDLFAIFLVSGPLAIWPGGALDLDAAHLLDSRPLPVADLAVAMTVETTTETLKQALVILPLVYVLNIAIT